MALKKQHFKDCEIPIFDEAYLHKQGEYWQFCRWITKKNKYARKSLRLFNKSKLDEGVKASYLQIYSNLQQGKTYFSIEYLKGVLDEGRKQI